MLCDVGCIYALPCKASCVLRIDPANGTTASFGYDLSALGCPGMGRLNWASTLRGPDGTLYSFPLDSTSVLCFHPVTGRASTFGNLSEGGFKYCDEIFAPDGCFYVAPAVAVKRVLHVDPVARTETQIGEELETNEYSSY